MKFSLLLVGFFAFTLSFSQNIDDNKVSFQYIQLPLQKINSKFTTYEVRVNHSYKNANNDSLTVFNSRKEAAQKTYELQYSTWIEQKKTLDRAYLTQMATYEKNVNAGLPATLPTQPNYPLAPIQPTLGQIKLHTELTDADVSNAIVIQGFEKGLGGSMVTIDVHPIRNVKIIETKTGTGASTKYEYKCQYILPVDVSFETPTDGQLYKKILFDNVQTYAMKSYPSKYEYELWLLDNKEKFFTDMEREVRKSTLAEVNSILNNQFGFVKTTRGTEIYTVKKYKDHDYKDVIEAYTLTNQAFALVIKDRNHASALTKLDLAISKWNSILTESNTIDEKSRVNDKITAMIQCNIAELYLWKGDFDQSENFVNLALNSGVMKFRNHAERVQGYYKDQRSRWEVHY